MDSLILGLWYYFDKECLIEMNWDKGKLKRIIVKIAKNGQIDARNYIWNFFGGHTWWCLRITSGFVVKNYTWQCLGNLMWCQGLSWVWPHTRQTLSTWKFLVFIPKTAHLYCLKLIKINNLYTVILNEDGE